MASCCQLLHLVLKLHPKSCGFVITAADAPGRAMVFSSLGSLGLRCSLRLDMEDDLPRLKNERQLPTGDFLDLMGGLFLQQTVFQWVIILETVSGY